MIDLLKKKPVFTAACTAAIICLLVYLRALSCDFVNWEDQDYVINNTAIRHINWDFFVWAFTTMPLAFWLPLTWLSFAIDYQLWGLNPFGYHLTNVILHSVSTGLVVLVADRLFCLSSQFKYETDKRSEKYVYALMLFMAGIAWGIHPARVESVVWVTERKDVLNGLFTITSILFYLRYLKMKNEGYGKKEFFSGFFISLLFFSFSLMSKPSSVVLPVLLFVIDWYPLGRVNKSTIFSVLLEKIPYIFLAAVLTFVTLFANVQQNSLNPLSEFPLMLRSIAAGNSVFEYCLLMLYPVGILPYYDLPHLIPKIYIVKAFIVTVIVCSTVWWGRKVPWLSALLILFVISLLPILHFTAGGHQLIIAPRYTYLPSVLPSVILVGVFFVVYRKFITIWPLYRRGTIIILIALLLTFYGFESYSLIGDWKNSGAMWSRVIEKMPFDKAYYYRGLYYVDIKKYRAAVEDYSSCLEMMSKNKDPESYNLYAFRGEALLFAGEYQSALNDFNIAISMFPHRLYFFYRATTLMKMGRINEAENDFRHSGQINGQINWIQFGSPLE